MARRWWRRWWWKKEIDMTAEERWVNKRKLSSRHGA